MSLPVLVAVMLVAATVGVRAERRWGDRAERASRSALGLLLKWVLPPVYLVLVSRVHVDGTLLGGLAVGYVAIGLAGTAAWYVASRVLHLPRATVGAVILAVIIANTGYFGLPLTRAVLGSGQLGPAVAWDSLVAGPMFYLVAFGVGAAFGDVAGGPAASPSRLGAFVRNPLLWAAVAGLVLPWDAPDRAASVAQDVIVAILPVGFVVVGIQLSAQGEGGSILRGRGGRLISPEVGVAVGLRLLVAPLIVLGASVSLLDLPHGMLLQAAAPSGLNGMLVAHRFGLDLRPVAGSIVWTTVAMTIGVVVVTTVT